MSELPSLPELVKSLVPFGVVGLGIVAIVSIAWRKQPAPSLYLPMVAIVFIVGLVIFDRLVPPRSLLPSSSTPEQAPLPAKDVTWADTHTLGDWAGRDSAATMGDIPTYSVANKSLCDLNNIGRLATCWAARDNGYPSSVPTDITGTPLAWCAYKNSSISISTPPDGRAPPGRVYICTGIKASP